MIEHYLNILLDEIRSDVPPKSVLLAARYLMIEFDRDLLPDWVALLAGGNIEAWDAVIEEARTELEGEHDRRI